MQLELRIDLGLARPCLVASRAVVGVRLKFALQRVSSTGQATVPQETPGSHDQYLDRLESHGTGSRDKGCHAIVMGL